MGYILNRQTHYIDAFEMDEIRMRSLISEVREFLQAVSTQEDLWPIVEAGLRGEFEQEVEAI